MATKSEQLAACKIWNVAESDRAFSELGQECDKDKKAYLLRRHLRLRDQAESLYDQSRDAAYDEIHVSVARDVASELADA